ncbi:MAG: hypothetical protein ACRDPA_04915 [Solirubrobacteraceae bacterium]
MGYFAPVLGVLAGLAGIADTIPYVRDTMRGSTRPHRGSWLIWGVLAIVACVAQLADGASWSALMACTQAVVTGAVFLLAIRHGEGGMSTADLSLIALAGGGVIGWVRRAEAVASFERAAAILERSMASRTSSRSRSSVRLPEISALAP